MKIKKFLLILSIILFGINAYTGISYAQQGTILPDAGDNSLEECSKKILDYKTSSSNEIENVGQLLGCAITTGDIPLSLFPYFIQYFSNYLLGIVSIIALIFVIIGGYYYTVGAMIEKKEVGKTYIKNALLGMVLAFLAWSIINVILAAIT
ncbi:hypothetical protein GF376_04510 [Candidatus Peregrinibacteria bacterium]|nr:hypothetical protein [Candidatus Peregrinibacteria bacterium]